MSTDKPDAQHCPKCGAANISEECGGYIEIGQWNGSSYEREMFVEGFKCEDCGQEWWQ